jgi:hypothetical protein
MEEEEEEREKEERMDVSEQHICGYILLRMSWKGGREGKKERVYRGAVSPSRPSPHAHTLPCLVTATQWLLPHAKCTTADSKPVMLRALRNAA